MLVVNAIDAMRFPDGPVENAPIRMDKRTVLLDDYQRLDTVGVVGNGCPKAPFASLQLGPTTTSRVVDDCLNPCFDQGAGDRPLSSRIFGFHVDASLAGQQQTIHDSTCCGQSVSVDDCGYQ